MVNRKFFLLILPIIFLGLLGVAVWQNNNRINNYVAAKILDYSGHIDPKNRVGIYEGQEVYVPDLALIQTEYKVLGVSTQEKLIEVDLSDQTLKAWDGSSLFLQTPVSTGLPWFPTPTGDFNIWIKLRATRMEGGEGKYYYNLPNVPYTMFFQNAQVPSWRGYGVHGAYWHNDFGKPHSHGCVNLPLGAAEKLYYWALPTVPTGKSMVYASADNPGTRVVIHD